MQPACPEMMQPPNPAHCLPVPLENHWRINPLEDLLGMRIIILQNSNHYKHYPLATDSKVQKSHRALVLQQLIKVNKMEVLKGSVFKLFMLRKDDSHFVGLT